MSRGDKYISGEREWERGNRRGGLVCISPKNDESDQCYHHCGCLDCRRRRNDQSYNR